MEIPLLEALGEDSGLSMDMNRLGERLGVNKDLAELSVVEELGGLRNLGWSPSLPQKRMP